MDYLKSTNQDSVNGNIRGWLCKCEGCKGCQGGCEGCQGTCRGCKGGLTF